VLLVSDINIYSLTSPMRGRDSSTHRVCVFVTALAGATSHLKAKVKSNRKHLT